MKTSVLLCWALAAGAVAVTVGLIAFSRASREGGALPRLPEGIQQAEPASLPFGGVPFKLADVELHAGRALDSTSVGLAGIPAAARAEFARVGAAALGAVWAGDLDAYKALLRSLGLDPDARSPRELKSVEVWAVSADVFRGAEVKPEGITARVLMVRGRPVAGSDVPPVGHARISARPSTPRGPEDVLDPASAGATVVELRIPARLASADGTRHDAEFAVELTLRPSDARWIVTGFAVVGPVHGRPFSVPLP